MVSPIGRAARIVAGAAMIGGGLFVIGGTPGAIVAAVGLVPLVAGAVDGCLFARLFGYHLSGSRTRAAL
ncbi:MAG: DUF2892 domain-containing protein [Chloroflexi bacterium]|nr:DUF2892 domain-containing protein [Chloroflexota bacterium]